MRIESILKRSQLSESVQIGTVDVYLDQNQCLRDGKEIHLTTKERQLLMTLLDAQGITVTRATIVEELRGDAALYENNEGTLDVYIANLRKKIGKEYIVTVK